LIEGVDVERATNEIGGDVCSKIGERQDEIGSQRQDLVDVRRSERTHPRLFTARLRRAYGMAGDPDDAVCSPSRYSVSTVSSVSRQFAALETSNPSRPSRKPLESEFPGR
jgi:hypothetical protein